MNQLDWEKMQEDVKITDVARAGETWSYNPSGYAPSGSTSLVSGSVSNLKSDDGVYMIFRSYNSGNTTVQPIANMNFTSDATGWVYGESADTVATGAWDTDSGRTDPGCYNFTIVDNLATAFYSIDQFINYSFTVDPLPSQAIVYGSVRLTSDDDFLFWAEIRLVRPDNSVTTVWVGDTYSGSTAFDSGWINVTVDASSNFTLTGTYQLSLFTHSETDDLGSAATKATLVHYWDDAGITLTVPKYTSEVEFTGSSNTEDWSQLSWTVDSAWTVGSVNVTLQLFNYTLGDYPTSENGYIAYTSGDTPNIDETKNQTITVNPTDFRNATGYWRMKIKGVKATDTQFDFKVDWIEFKVVTDSGTLFTFENAGSLTSHVVSLWIINSTNHRRYDANLFINSGEEATYIRADIRLPSTPFIAKVVTERGNMAVFARS
jgi:hypothetical protein